MKYLIALLLLASCTNNETPEHPTPVASPAATEAPVAYTPGAGPKVGDKFLIHTGDVSEITMKVDAYFIDLDSDIKGHEKLPWVGAYMSVGSAEKWREDYDALSCCKLSKMKGWSGEYWLDIRKPEVLEVMKKRIDKMHTLGMKGFYTDNSDVMNHEDVIKKEDNMKYLKAISDYAHAKGMLIFMNNGLEMIKDTVGTFDGYINEQSIEYKETDMYLPVAGKYPIFHIEYSSKYCKPVSGHTVMLASGLGQEKFEKWCD